jgi:hypothetical protein
MVARFGQWGQEAVVFPPRSSQSPLSDLTSRYVAGLSDELGWIVGVAVLLLVAVIALLRPVSSRPVGETRCHPKEPRRVPPNVEGVPNARVPGTDIGHEALERRLYAAAALAFAIGGSAWALHLAWVGDDAYISFRYAQNLVEGHGLVYNPGERVEGYTNFVWILLLAPFAAAGLDLALVSIALSLLCSCAAVGLSAYLVRRCSPHPTRLGFSIASSLLAFNYVVACYGTSGLETMLGALLVLWAVERADQGAALASGVLAILATMTHPDHAIFYGAIGATLLSSRDRWRLLGRFGVPFVALYVPYFAWRWSYYGEFFPNPYYAKSADLSYFRQGFRYLSISGWSSGLFVALPAAIAGVIRLRQHFIARFTAIAVPFFLLYVAKIGGDFMLGRLLLPILPPVYIMAELGIRALAHEERRSLRALCLAALGLLGTAAIPVRLIAPGEKYQFIADERTFYPVARFRPFALNVDYWHWAEAFNTAFAGLSRKPTLAMGSPGIVGYLTSLRMIDNHGLLHRGVAHALLRTRGRPGHEKMIGPGVLVQSDVDLWDMPVYPAMYERYGAVNVAGVEFSTVRYDAVFFGELARAGVRQPDLLRYIKDYRPPRGKGAASRFECDLWYMNQIYFLHNQDEARRKMIVERVLEHRPEWRGYEDFILEEPEAGFADWIELSRDGFDQLAPGTHVAGAAFANNPVSRESAGQRSPAGTRGRFMNSFQENDANLATGTLLTPPFIIEGDAITLKIGGGRAPEELYVELLVDGVRRHVATGCGTEILGRRLWPTAELRGKPGRLQMVDLSTGAWGHLLVDELVQWRRRSPKPGALPGEMEASAPTLRR